MDISGAAGAEEEEEAGAGRLIEVLYGDRSGGGTGVMANADGSYGFAVNVSGPGGALTPAMAPGGQSWNATGAAQGYCRTAGGEDYEECD